MKENIKSLRVYSSINSQSLETIMINIDNAIKIAVKTGNVQIGGKKSVRLLKTGASKLVVVANNCPKDLLADLETYSKLTDIPIHPYRGSNWDLGFICGKPFIISCLSVITPGDSDILKLREEEPPSK